MTCVLLDDLTYDQMVEFLNNVWTNADLDKCWSACAECTTRDYDACTACEFHLDD